MPADKMLTLKREILEVDLTEGVDISRNRHVLKQGSQESDTVQGLQIRN